MSCPECGLHESTGVIINNWLIHGIWYQICQQCAWAIYYGTRRGDEEKKASDCLS